MEHMKVWNMTMVNATMLDQLHYHGGKRACIYYSGGCSKHM